MLPKLPFIFFVTALIFEWAICDPVNLVFLNNGGLTNQASHQNVQVQETSAKCNPGNKGLLRMSNLHLEFCNGRSWVRVSEKTAPGKSCLDIKNQGLSRGDGVYRLDPDGGSSSNAFLAYCDMTSYIGGWTMCYTTDEYAKPRTEVTYSSKTPYGNDGYRTNCNNIPFTEIMFVDHQTGNKVYFKRKSNLPVIAAANYGKPGSALGLWDAVGASRSYSYQLLICDISFYSGFMVSGFTGNCYKQCDNWCGDKRSPYFRTAPTHSGLKGVAFNVNGHQVVSSRLMSVGLR
ncbi:PREDICTED: uncharacterized protein LOC107351079 isoform X3 [Acropora digitifera]|uniref:uncharacterized protein LOC107351079 isoform X3 n=1 Tax=Acropora digitifera TaxID=70779 RepID=UPI00077A39C5|nr:PREDICTED: uncharacterized protein LOC107351079 isoform X3 [Acropora digitifera]